MWSLTRYLSLYSSSTRDLLIKLTAHFQITFFLNWKPPFPSNPSLYDTCTTHPLLDLTCSRTKCIFRSMNYPTIVNINNPTFFSSSWIDRSSKPIPSSDCATRREYFKDVDQITTNSVSWAGGGKRGFMKTVERAHWGASKGVHHETMKMTKDGRNRKEKGQSAKNLKLEDLSS